MFTGEATIPAAVTVTGIVAVTDQMTAARMTTVTAASAIQDMGEVTVSALSSCSGVEILSTADFL